MSLFSASKAAPVADTTTELLQHLALERIPAQWAAFLSLLGAELSAELPADELRQFLVRLGEAFARERPLPPCDDIPALEAAINSVWAGMQWGYASVADAGQHMTVTHRACPLPAAMQIDTDIAGGFLQGVYDVWLHAAGAPAELGLSQLSANGVPMCMVFELSAN